MLSIAKKYLLSAVIGGVVGFVGGLQGIAGAFYISALLLMTGVMPTQRLAAGTTLIAILPPISLGAAYTYWKSGDVDLKVAMTVAITYSILAYYGAQYNKQVTEKSVILSLSILMFMTSLYFFHKYVTM
jgi:uncharacterized protein